MINPKKAVVIPCYKVSQKIIGVLNKIPHYVDHIIVVDDGCPEQTASVVRNNFSDPRLVLLEHKKNLGVGAAMQTGYRKALDLNCDIVVKVDGDGQMDPNLIEVLIQPIVLSDADYVKGNRFYFFDSLKTMPFARLFGNSALSFIVKSVSGYWGVMDPTNGFTAIHKTALQRLRLEKLDRGYFFETDMLYQLNTIRAVLAQVPMDSVYGNSNSSLHISKILIQFPLKLLNRLLKRLVFNYFVRDFNSASLQLILGLLFFIFGSVFGFFEWKKSYLLGTPASSGTVMLASLPIILGFQMLLSFLNFDLQNTPKTSLQKKNL